MVSLAQKHTALNGVNDDSRTSFAASASGVIEEARERLEGAGEIVKSVVINRPVLALGAALAAGVILGWLIKRR